MDSGWLGCFCEFISCNKCPTLVGDVDMGEVIHVWRQRGVWEISETSPEFCYEPKSALKMYSLFTK